MFRLSWSAITKGSDCSDGVGLRKRAVGEMDAGVWLEVGGHSNHGIHTASLLSAVFSMAVTDSGGLDNVLLQEIGDKPLFPALKVLSVGSSTDGH